MLREKDLSDQLSFWSSNFPQYGKQDSIKSNEFLFGTFSFLNSKENCLLIF